MDLSVTPFATEGGRHRLFDRTTASVPVSNPRCYPYVPVKFNPRDGSALAAFALLSQATVARDHAHRLPPWLPRTFLPTVASDSRPGLHFLVHSNGRTIEIN